MGVDADEVVRKGLGSCTLSEVSLKFLAPLRVCFLHCSDYLCCLITRILLQVICDCGCRVETDLW